MSITDWILGSKDVKEKIVDGVYNGVDNMVYTEQEKKDNHAKFLALYEPFKVAQRYLSLIFGLPFACLHTGIFALRVAFWDAPLFQESAKFIQGDINDSLGLIVLTIVGFYFAGGTVEGAIKAFKR
tara:strand:+ start:190 stop:567 length:378 start_codon:yes stop_codon:yes gene_type:complete